MEILWKPTEMIILFGSIPVSVGLDLVQRWLFLSSSEYYFWTFQCWTNPSHTTILKHIHTMYRININKHDSLYMNMYVYIYTLMYIYVWMNIYIYAWKHIYIYIYARICVYIYTRWILIPDNLYQYEYTWQNQNPSGLALALTILLALAKVWVKTGNTCILRLFPFFRDLHMDFPGIYTVFFIHNITIYPIISPQIHAPSMKLSIFELSVPDVIPSCRTRRFAAMGRPSACGFHHHKMREDHTQTGGLQGDMSRTGQEIVEPAI